MAILSMFAKAILTSTFFLLTQARPTRSLLRDLPANVSPNPEKFPLLQRQDTDDIDLGDQSWVKSYTALGDSYAAGIGAGSGLSGSGDSGCSRYDASYPSLINEDERLGDSSGRAFSFLACSGAVTDDVIKKQLPAMPGNQDLITISIGGNDLGLVDILNECVFQWYSLYRPGLPFSYCDSALSDASNVVNSGDFSSKLDQILSTAKSKLSGNGKIYWTGYGHFFGTDDNQCDGVTWAFWRAYGFRQYLTLERRKTMNGLVDQINSKISDAVNRAGSQAAFVDYSGHFENLVSGFCEAGWPETDGNRAGLAFYEWDTDDNKDADNIQPRQDSSAAPPVIINGTFEAQINHLIMQYLQTVDNNAESDQVTLLFQPPPLNDTNHAGNGTGRYPFGNATTGIPSNNTRRSTTKRRQLDPRQDVGDVSQYNFTTEQLAVGTQLSIIPDSYRRIFHPRPYGHAMIANHVIYAMVATSAEKASIPVPAFSFDADTCPVGEGGAAQTCHQNSVTSVPSKLVGASGDIEPNQLLYSLREVICNNKCEAPAGLPDGTTTATGHKQDGDCEISVPITGDLEAYFYRQTPSVDDQWQQCWDETQSVIDHCVQNGPNEGWVNGPPASGQFYQGGFRPKNGPGSLHSPFQGETPLKTPDGTDDGAGAGGIVGPDQGNEASMKCGTSDIAGTDLSNCFNLMNAVIGGGFLLSDTNTTEGICTDSDFCLRKGDSKSSDGKETLGSYCEIAAVNGCAVVLATKASSFGGFPGKSCVSPAKVYGFVHDAPNTCSGDNAWAAAYKGGESSGTSFPYTVLGMVNQNSPGSVYVP